MEGNTWKETHGDIVRRHVKTLKGDIGWRHNETLEGNTQIHWKEIWEDTWGHSKERCG